MFRKEGAVQASRAFKHGSASHSLREADGMVDDGGMGWCSVLHLLSPETSWDFYPPVIKNGKIIKLNGKTSMESHVWLVEVSCFVFWSSGHFRTRWIYLKGSVPAADPTKTRSPGAIISTCFDSVNIRQIQGLPGKQWWSNDQIGGRSTQPNKSRARRVKPCETHRK